MQRNLSFLYVLLLLCSAQAYSSSLPAPEVKDGVIDIGAWNFQKNDIFLHGNWEFYWDTLMLPGEIQSLPDSFPQKYIGVPSAWSSKKQGSYTIRGKATYRLIMHTTGLEGTYAIRLFDFFTASKVWFDGRLIYSTGEAGFSKKTSDPGFAYRDVPLLFNKDVTEHELVVQISNFHHTRSGIVKPVKFGTYERLTAQSRNWLILILLVVGIILFISINHLLSFFLYKNESTHLFFGLLCLVMILRNISTGQRILTYILPGINWQLLFKLDNFSGFGTIPLFAIFLFMLYRKEFPKIIFYILVTIGLLITLFVLFTPQMIYGRYRMVYELYLLAGGLFLTFYVLLKATLKRREGALLTFIGFFILYSTAINDVLISMGVANGAEVAPFGLLTYMLIQSFVLSKGSAQAVEENRKLGLAIQEEKKLLEKRVAERTAELETRNQEIVKQQEILKNQAWFNESLARVNVVLNNYNKSDLKILTNNLISEILELLDAQVGVIYIVNESTDKPMLELTGSKNASREIQSAEPVAPGEGLLGACFMEMQSHLMNDISENFVKLDSGLGQTNLKNLILVPLHTNMRPLGVMEIASFHEFDHEQVKLLEKISESISSTVQFLKLNTKNLSLLKEYTEKQDSLDRSETDMRNQLEELAALREEVDYLKRK